jgi:hypothetical protein
MDERGSRKPTASRQMIQLKRQALALAARFSGPPPDRADLYGDQPWEGLDLETRQRGRLARYGRPYRDTGFVNAACESTKMRNAPPRYHVVQKISAAVTSVVLAMGALAEGIGNRTFAIAPPSQPLSVPRARSSSEPGANRLPGGAHDR